MGWWLHLLWGAAALGVAALRVAPVLVGVALAACVTDVPATALSAALAGTLHSSWPVGLASVVTTSLWTWCAPGWDPPWAVWGVALIAADHAQWPVRPGPVLLLLGTTLWWNLVTAWQNEPDARSCAQLGLAAASATWHWARTDAARKAPAVALPRGPTTLPDLDEPAEEGVQIEEEWYTVL